MANMILAGALRGLGRAGMSIGQQYPGYKQGQRQLLKEEEQEQFLRDFKNREFEFEMDRRRQNAELRAMDMRNRATDQSATAEHRAGLLGQSTLRTENQVASNRAAEEYRANQLALDRDIFESNKGAGETGSAVNEANARARADYIISQSKLLRNEEYVLPGGEGLVGDRQVGVPPDSISARANRFFPSASDPSAIDTSGAGGMGGYPTFGGFGVGGYSLTGAGAGVNPTAAPGGGQLLQTTAPGDDTGVLQTGGQQEALTQMQAMGAESYEDVFRWSQSNPKKSDGTPYSEIEIEEFLMIAGIAFGRTR